MISSALRLGFAEGVEWERARAVRDRCVECGVPTDDHGMCGSCLHDARRSGWEPGA